MSIVHVCSKLENSVSFQLKDEFGAPKDPIIIEGKHPYHLRRGGAGLILPYVITTLDAKDWEEVKRLYGHCYYLKAGIIFSEKNKHETVARAEDVENKPTGIAQITPDKLTSGGKNNNPFVTSQAKVA